MVRALLAGPVWHANRPGHQEGSDPPRSGTVKAKNATFFARRTAGGSANWTRRKRSLKADRRTKAKTEAEDFRRADKVRVGVVGDMPDILGAMERADKVVTV
jgi:hypothetical protein